MYLQIDFGKKEFDMKLVREHINEDLGFTEDSDPIKDMGIGKVPYNYHNLFIAKRDIEYYTKYTNHKKVNVPKGTIITAQGGGTYGNRNAGISIGMIDKVNGKSVSSYHIANDKDNYTEIHYDVWEKVTELTKKIENWARDNVTITSSAKTGNLDKLIDTIDHQDDVINKIEELLK